MVWPQILYGAAGSLPDLRRNGVAKRAKVHGFLGVSLPRVIVGFDDRRF
jgi:hypothetical protein